MWEILAFCCVALALSGVLALLFRVTQMVDINDVTIDEDEELFL